MRTCYRLKLKQKNGTIKYFYRFMYELKPLLLNEQTTLPTSLPTMPTACPIKLLFLYLAGN